MNQPLPGPPDHLRGVLPVFQTPLLDDESIDFETLEREIDWLLDNGADGIVMAMVSETLRLDSAERGQLAEAACRFAAGRCGVVISVGAESTHTAVRYAIDAQKLGATAVMAIPPISTALGEDELTQYYERILAAVDIPLIVQDASSYVGQPMSLAMQAGLLQKHGPQRVMFKPEAAPMGPRLSALREATDGKAIVFEGSGGMTLVDSYRRGIAGTMPAAELVDVFAVLWKALESGDEETIYRLSPPIASLVALQVSLDGYLAIEKYLLVKRGVFRSAKVRSPVGYLLDDETRREVDRLFELIMNRLAECKAH